MKIYIRVADDFIEIASEQYDDVIGCTTEVEVDDGFDLMSIGNYRYRDGEMVWTGEQDQAQREQQEEDEQDQAIADASKAFFSGGGKEQMEADIEAAASGGGADTQLQAIARMQVMTMDLSPVASSTIAEFRDYWPEWEKDHEYKKNDPLQWEGQYYRVSQPHTSSEVYPPDVAGESMYYPVTIADDGIIVYRECHGDYDMVMDGETRHYPDSDGPVYRAKVDTAYDPSAVPDNWELVDDADSD